MSIKLAEKRSANERDVLVFMRDLKSSQDHLPFVDSLLSGAKLSKPALAEVQAGMDIK
jgi:hypothetical protein